MKGCYKPILRTTVAVAIAIAYGCAPKPKEEAAPLVLISENIKSFSIDCNMEFSNPGGRARFFANSFPIDMKFNASACDSLEKQLRAILAHEGRPKDLPIVKTLALSSARLYQSDSHVDVKKMYEQSANRFEKAGRDTTGVEIYWLNRLAYAQAQDVLPMLMTPSFKSQYERVLSKAGDSIAQANAPPKGTHLSPLVLSHLWEEEFSPTDKSEHLHISLWGYYNTPGDSHKMLYFSCGRDQARGNWGLYWRSLRGPLVPSDIVRIAPQVLLRCLQRNAALG